MTGEQSKKEVITQEIWSYWDKLRPEILPVSMTMFFITLPFLVGLFPWFLSPIALACWGAIFAAALDRVGLIYAPVFNSPPTTPHEKSDRAMRGDVVYHSLFGSVASAVVIALFTSLSFALLFTPEGSDPSFEIWAFSILLGMIMAAPVGLTVLFLSFETAMYVKSDNQKEAAGKAWQTSTHDFILIFAIIIFFTPKERELEILSLLGIDLSEMKAVEHDETKNEHLSKNEERPLVYR
jgi:ABC-type enterobactin transport system permease subunit